MGCGCNNTNDCEECQEPCGCKLTIPSLACVTYDGPAIPVLGVITGDSLEAIINKISQTVTSLDERISLLE